MDVDTNTASPKRNARKRKPVSPALGDDSRAVKAKTVVKATQKPNKETDELVLPHPYRGTQFGYSSDPLCVFEEIDQLPKGLLGIHPSHEVYMENHKMLMGFYLDAVFNSAQ
ncbi:MAG: hypothetical protein DRR06_18825, partial [Gammaproteobacteria bacterium]